MSRRQLCKIDRLLKSFGLKERYNCVSSAWKWKNMSCCPMMWPTGNISGNKLGAGTKPWIYIWSDKLILCQLVPYKRNHPSSLAVNNVMYHLHRDCDSVTCTVLAKFKEWLPKYWKPQVNPLFQSSLNRETENSIMLIPLLNQILLWLHLVCLCLFVCLCVEH